MTIECKTALPVTLLTPISSLPNMARSLARAERVSKQPLKTSALYLTSSLSTACFRRTKMEFLTSMSKVWAKSRF